jgi:hypothetical protein
MTTAMFGNRAKRKRQATGVPIPKVAGLTAMPAGLGSRTSRLAGRRIITDVGSGCAGSVGSGCLVMNGRRPGFPGGRARITSAGRRCRPKRASIAAAAFIIGSIIIMTSALTSTHSFRATISARNTSAAPLFRASATSISRSKRQTLPGSLSPTRRSSTKAPATRSCVRAGRGRSSVIVCAGSATWKRRHGFRGMNYRCPCRC